jgi:hypothetical protein
VNELEHIVSVAQGGKVEIAGTGHQRNRCVRDRSHSMSSNKHTFHVNPVQEGQADTRQQQVLRLLWFEGIIELQAVGALGSRPPSLS